MKIGAGAVERALQSVRLDRLHQIIDRFDLEGGDGELVERGDEHDGGRGVLRGERAGNADPVEAGHRDVEQQQVGMKRLGQVDCAVAVARRADQLRAFGSRQQELQSLGRERLVIGNQYAKRVWLSAIRFHRHRQGDLEAAAGHRAETAARAIAEPRLQPLADVRRPRPVPSCVAAGSSSLPPCFRRLLISRSMRWSSRCRASIRMTTALRLFDTPYLIAFSTIG